MAVFRYGSLAMLRDADGSISVAGINAALLAGMAGLNLLPVLLLLVVSVTVALLMFARAAARESELAVRTALGASRRRIVGQFFLEALVLAALASTLGLAATGIGLRWLIGMVEAEVLDGQPVPFWIRDGISATTIAYAACLTVLGALVAGAAPALKLTRGVGARLKQGTVPIRDEEFLGVQVRVDRQPQPGDTADTSLAAFAALYRQTFEELARRMGSDPNVLGVTYAERLPRTDHGWNQIEVDAGAVEPMDEGGHRVARAAVDVDYFDVLGAPVSAGRGFTLADLEPGAPVVLVDEPFVERVLGGANPIGRRIRYVASQRSRDPSTEGPWYEIVGITRCS